MNSEHGSSRGGGDGVSPLPRGHRGPLQVRRRRYDVAWTPLTTCPLDGWRACLVQAFPADCPGGPPVELTLYARQEPAEEAGDDR